MLLCPSLSRPRCLCPARIHSRQQQNGHTSTRRTTCTIVESKYNTRIMSYEIGNRRKVPKKATTRVQIQEQVGQRLLYDRWKVPRRATTRDRPYNERVESP